MLAVPAPSARKLLHEIAPQVSAAYGKVEVASMAVVALALPPGTELPQRSGILIAEGERYSDRITPFTAKAFQPLPALFHQVRGGDDQEFVHGIAC